MSLRINRKKLPVKYALEVFSSTSGYPSHQDLEYVLVWILQEKNMLEKNFTPANLWSGMQNHIGTIDELRGFLEYLAIPDDPKDKKEFNVNIQKVSADTYRLVSHPWVAN